eukprot:215009_1
MATPSTKLTLQFKTITSQTVSATVDSNSHIMDLSGIAGFLWPEHQLMDSYHKRLQAHKKLCDYGLKNGDTIDIVPNCRAITFYVELSNNTIAPVRGLAQKDGIMAVKRRLDFKRLDEIDLYLNGTKLLDEQTLDECNIFRSCVVQACKRNQKPSYHRHWLKWDKLNPELSSTQHWIKQNMSDYSYMLSQHWTKRNEFDEKKDSYRVRYSFNPETKKLGNHFEETFKRYKKIEISTNNTEETLNALYYGLKQLGCTTEDTQKYLKRLKKQSESQICAVMYAAQKKQKSTKYISKLKKIQPVQKNDVKTEDDADKYFEANGSKFKAKLDYNFNTFTQDQQSRSDFKKEFAKQMGVDPSQIEIKEVKKGSVWIVIAIAAAVVVTGYIIGNRVQHIAVPVQAYRMRPNDQIQVKYQNVWYGATISSTTNTAIRNGTDFTIRYNRNINGENIFWFNERNIETLNTMRDVRKIRVPGQAFNVQVGVGGAIIQNTHHEPPLAVRANVNGIVPGDHFYAQIYHLA